MVKSVLKDCLVKSALEPLQCPGGTRCATCKSGCTDCMAKNVVYEIRCNLCSSSPLYVGETKRPIRERFNEHLRGIRNCQTDEEAYMKPVVNHFLWLHADKLNVDVPISIRILERTSDHVDRKIRETMHIRDTKPVLNDKSSSWTLLPNRF